jgi:hypothetical protein
MKTPRLAVAPHTPGFNIPISRQTNLGIAMLILEDEEGRHEPINFASMIDEAHEMAINDSQRRGPDTARQSGSLPRIGFCRSVARQDASVGVTDSETPEALQRQLWVVMKNPRCDGFGMRSALLEARETPAPACVL